MSEDAHEISPVDEKIKPTYKSANDFLRFFVVCFCENLAELGCPRTAEPDMWYRYLSVEDQMTVIEKLNKIIERDYIKS